MKHKEHKTNKRTKTINDKNQYQPRQKLSINKTKHMQKKTTSSEMQPIHQDDQDILDNR